MSVIQSLKETSTKAKFQGEHYLETSKRYFELKVFQQITLALSYVTKVALIGGLLFLSLIFILIGGTLALGAYLGNMALSAILVALALLVLAFIAFKLRKRINRRIIQKVAKEFFED